MAQKTKVGKYIAEHAEANATPEEIAELKKRFWDEERKEYNKQKREKQKEVRFAISVSEWEEIEADAKLLGMKTTTYCRESLRSYRDGIYLSPDTTTLVDLYKTTRRIHASVNGVCHAMHLMRSYDNAGQLEQLLGNMNSLVRELKDTCNHSPNIYDEVKRLVETDPTAREKLVSIIQQNNTNASDI